MESPLSTLPDTARAVLEAANRLLIKEGLRKLTLTRIEEESGEYGAAVSYYFGGKAGLIRALLEANFHDEMLAMEETTKNPSRESVDRLMDAMDFITTRLDSYVVFFELFPHVLRHEEYRKTLRTAMDWYRRRERKWVEAAGGEFSALNEDQKDRMAELISAVMDGLAIQLLINPEQMDIRRTYAVFQEMVEKYLKP